MPLSLTLTLRLRGRKSDSSSEIGWEWGNDSRSEEVRRKVLRYSEWIRWRLAKILSTWTERFHPPTIREKIRITAISTYSHMHLFDSLSLSLSLMSQCRNVDIGMSWEVGVSEWVRVNRVASRSTSSQRPDRGHFTPHDYTSCQHPYSHSNLLLSRLLSLYFTLFSLQYGRIEYLSISLSFVCSWLRLESLFLSFLFLVLFITTLKTNRIVNSSFRVWNTYVVSILIAIQSIWAFYFRIVDVSALSMFETLSIDSISRQAKCNESTLSRRISLHLVCVGMRWML